MSPIRVMLIDDHPIVRQGVRSLLSNFADIELVAEVEDGQTAVAAYQNSTPDVTLLDIRMPTLSGLEVLKLLRQQDADACILMLTSFEDDEYILEALKSGAQGYVLKSVSDETLVQAIRGVHRGERILSPQITEQVVQNLLQGSLVPHSAAEEESPLTEDELQILNLLATGASNADVADLLFISPTTLKRKLRRILEKMNAHSRTQAVAEAVRRGWI